MFFLSIQPQTGGLSWPVFYVIILSLALLMSSYILWRRYLSRQQLMRQVTELEALGRAGSAIVASQLNLSALCELIAQEAGQVIDNRTFQIGLFENNHYRIEFWTINGLRQPTPQVYNLREDSGVVGWIKESQKPLLVHDFQKEQASLPAKPRYISDSPPRSAVFIPLISGNEVFGIVAAQSEQPNRFDAEDLRRLSILANQAASAIANAQLYEQEKTRAAQLELVGSIAQKVNQLQDLEELFDKVVSLTQETFNFNSVNIFMVDRETGAAVIEASSIPDLETGSLRVEPGMGLIGTAVSSRSSTLANNTAEDNRFRLDAVSTDTRSEIAIPLIANEELLGVLDVQSQTIGAFGTSEQTVLEALAAQVAIAIQKARQFAAQREQAWITTAQLQVAETVSQHTEMEALTESLARLTPILLGVPHCSILLWEDEREQYYGTATFGFEPDEASRFEQIRLSIGDWNPLDAVHVGQERFITYKQLPWLSTNGQNPAAAQQNMLCPLTAKGQMLGVMVVDLSQPSHNGSGPERSYLTYNGREEILKNILTQGSQAIENIELYLAQQEESWVNTALLQVAEAVNRLTDLNEILDTIVRMVPMLVGVQTCVILIWDEEKGVFWPGPSHGLSEMADGVLKSFEIDPAEFPVAGQGQDLERVGPYASYYPMRLPNWLHDVMGAETADIFPLYARAQLVGAMLVGPAPNGYPLSGRRVNIMTGIAQQAAIAVVNDQLYKESAERSRMEQELDVARSIQTSLIPTGNPDIPGCEIASFWQAARQVSGDFYDFLELADGRWGIAIADVADKGVPAALFMALSRTILRTVAFNRHQPAQVLARTNEIICKDAQTDLFVTVFYAIWNPKTRLLTYASGGHNPPTLFHKNGESTELKAKGIALGILPQFEFQQKEITLQAEDLLIFYTDGVTEAMNEDLDEFGLDRLCATIEQSRTKKASAIVQEITKAIQTHAGETPQFDDITLITMKIQ